MDESGLGASVFELLGAGLEGQGHDDGARQKRLVVAELVPAYGRAITAAE